MMQDRTLQGVVNLIKPVSYLKSLEVLEEYDVALIIETDWDESVFLPTKVSDFMMQGQRIFTISPQNGLLHDMYCDGYISYFADVMDKDSIKEALFHIVKNSKTKEWNEFNVKIPDSFKPQCVLEQYLNFKILFQSIINGCP